nr:SGNH/GDSL hydrolase family protein [Propionibacterium sp.]
MKRRAAAILTAILSLFAAFAAGTPAAAAPGKAQGPKPYQIVSLGDSFAAGSTLDPAYVIDIDCDRSSLAYPTKLIGKFTQGPRVNRACTGDGIGDLTAQLAGVDLSKAKIIKLTIGGNDVGFGAITSCLAQAIATGTPAAGCVGLFDQAALSNLPANLAGTLASIRTLAPQAKIFVSGYPLVLGTGTNPVCGQQEQLVASLNYANGLLNDAIAGGVGAARTYYVDATYVDVVPAFAGQGYCAANPITEQYLLINQYLHPTADGQRAYANTFNGVIKAAFAA